MSYIPFPPLPAPPAPGVFLLGPGHDPQCPQARHEQAQGRPVQCAGVFATGQAPVVLGLAPPPVPFAVAPPTGAMPMQSPPIHAPPPPPPVDPALDAFLQGLRLEMGRVSDDVFALCCDLRRAVDTLRDALDVVVSGEDDSSSSPDEEEDGFWMGDRVRRGGRRRRRRYSDATTDDAPNIFLHPAMRDSKRKAESGPGERPEKFVAAREPDIAADGEQKNKESLTSSTAAELSDETSSEPKPKAESPTVEDVVD